MNYIGHFRRLRTEHSVAFAMVSHRRLGADSVFSAILHDLIKLITKHAESTGTAWPIDKVVVSEAGASVFTLSTPSAQP